MKYLFYLGHPAHFHLFKNVINNLKNKEHEVKILIKKKDILEDLLHSSGWDYININPEGRNDNKVSIAWNLLKRDFIFWNIARKFKPQLMIGTCAEISHAGFFLRIPSIVVNEDDDETIPLFSKIAYPLATNILAPVCCRVGKWESKKISYQGYHELAYLHPDNFIPDKSIAVKYADFSKPFFILRFAKLTAHHDAGARGINDEIAKSLIAALEKYGRVYISSERTILSSLEKYRIDINPAEIHHVMSFASLYIGDSQTMAAEAAVLGIPFIRYNDFIGKLSYLDELENKYLLGFGIKPGNEEQLIKKTEELLQTGNIHSIWKEKRKKMLSENVDVSKFFTLLFENYPISVEEWKKNNHQLLNQASGSTSRPA